MIPISEIHVGCFLAECEIMIQIAFQAPEPLWMPGWFSHVQFMYLHNCMAGQQFFPNPTFKVINSTIPRPQSPFNVLHIDFVDMIGRCNNYRYLMVSLFSSMIKAGPCVHCDAKSAATFLICEEIS